MTDDVTNIIVAGLGGQGVLTCANVISRAAFHAGYDVKLSEIHGMSQRGGSVSSDVRFGRRVWSPMVASGEAHFLLLLCPTQEERNRHYLRKDGLLLSASDIDAASLPLPATLNTALLGRLSRRLSIDSAAWRNAINDLVPSRFLAENLAAFELGCSNDK